MRAVIIADSPGWALHLHLSRGLGYSRLGWPDESEKTEKAF